MKDKLERYEKIKRWVFDRYQVNGYLHLFEDGVETKARFIQRLAAKKYLLD